MIWTDLRYDIGTGAGRIRRRISALLEEKQPHLGIINDAELSQLAQDPPDFLFSDAVLKHVPPIELGRYFANVTRLIGPRTRAVVFFMEGPRLYGGVPAAAHRHHVLDL